MFRSMRNWINVRIIRYLWIARYRGMLTIQPHDDVFVRIDCEESIALELSEYFAFDVPGARFMQSKFGKHWSGKIKLFNLANRRIYAGLIPRIIEFAHARQYDVANNVPELLPLGKNAEAFVQSLHIPLELRDYQWDAIREACNRHRCLILSPTGSGKSLIIYVMAR